MTLELCLTPPGPASGGYSVDLTPLATVAGRPTIFFTSARPGAAELAAAAAVMGRIATTWRILAPSSALPPESAALGLAPLTRDKARNARVLREAAKGFGRAYQALFIFLPDSRARRRWPHLGYGFAARRLGLSRFAAALDARLVPVWFSGSRKKRVLLPRLGAAPRRDELVCRLGTPILAQELGFFGSKLGDGLRAAVSSLKGHVSPLIAAPQRFLQALKPGQVEVRALTAHEVDKDRLIAFRRCSFPDDAWSAMDEASLHLVAELGGDYVGYYRLLPWREGQTALSPMHRAYHITPEAWASHSVLEMGRFCIDPGPQGGAIARRLWKGLHALALTLDRDPLILGLMSPNNVNPVVAAAQFEYLRRLAPCARTQGFLPRHTLRPLGEAHRFSIPDIAYAQPPKAAQLPSILRSYLNSGAKFGPPTLWRALDRRPAIIASIAPLDLQRNWGL